MNVNYYNPYVRAELELYHHGVAGQRWGKRHGPPYPLGKSQVSAAEKKAGWKESAWADGNPRQEKKYIKKQIRKLNALEQEGVMATDRYTRAGLQGLDAIQKMNKSSSKNKDELYTKLSDAALEQAVSKVEIRKAELRTNAIISDLANKGYTIKHKNIVSSATRGRAIASKVLLGTAVGSLGIGWVGMFTGNPALMAPAFAGMIGGTLGLSIADSTNRTYTSRKYKITRPGEKNNYPYNTVHSVKLEEAYLKQKIKKTNEAKKK